ncbi:MAG: hypothetical protein HRT68_16995, partial [Flavobacteriaceae bacterium]|nr:hypothetical protein [Flavobacteriaceae bacterium]
MKTIVSGSAWSFIGVILAASFFYWQEYRNPFDFRIELIDEFKLIEVKEKISDLKVIYKNEDILENEKEIKVIRFRISNLGDTILQTYYDQLEPFGIDFGKAKVLNVETISSNSDDLRRKLIKNFLADPEKDTSQVLFSKVIFESGDTILFKVTLLQVASEEL